MSSCLIKRSGQVFTPDYLVNLILDEAGYLGDAILSKHCIDNSCGDGAFLCEMTSRYISAYKNAKGTVDGVDDDIRKYIHGIEIDSVAYETCIENLINVCASFGVTLEEFDVYNEDAMLETRFDGRMDYVIGNPPYVRVHNLDDSYDVVKSYAFANGGMTDLYLVFFEKGFQMLKEGGKLCYITPSSWLNSLAGNVMRNYVRCHRNLVSLIDLGHFQAFNATTYTLVSLFENGVRRDSVTYNIFDAATFQKYFVEELPLTEIDINGCFYLATEDTLRSLREILSMSVPKYVTVKNGFATLADKVFISIEFPFTQFVIPVIKASTGKWYKAFFPYNNYGKPFDRAEIFANADIAHYLNTNKRYLLKHSSEANNPDWFLFGRTQALKDVAVDKLSVNTTIKDVRSIKLNEVPAGSGIYSGLYILSDIDFEIIKELLLTDEFVKYVASLKKYKSGGYYTFNTKDLEAYLNYTINQRVNDGKLDISNALKSGLFESDFACV